MSMTAYSRVSNDSDLGTVTWELKSVNNRYLDANLRMPEDFRVLDGPLRERLSKRVRRGKVDCTLRIESAQRAAGAIELNMELVEQVVKACRKIDGVLEHAERLSSLDVLRWPGVMESNALDPSEASAAILAAFDAALDEFVASRKREGERLAELIEQRLASIETIVSDVRTVLPEVIAAGRERLENRLADIRDQLDPARIEAEIVLFSQKVDVAEEVDRLDAHVSEVRRVLTLKEPIGRRLDFLMQELNREANTLGSKSVDTRTTGGSVELKVLIEQMREQIQNLE